MNYCKLLWLKASAKCAWKILLLAELQLKFLNLFFFLKFTYEIHTCHFCWCHDFVSVFDRQSQKRERRVAQLQLHASEGRERIKWTLQRQHGKLTARLQLRFQTIIPCASHENNKLTASEVLGLFSFFSNLFMKERLLWGDVLSTQMEFISRLDDTNNPHRTYLLYCQRVAEEAQCLALKQPHPQSRIFF